MKILTVMSASKAAAQGWGKNWAVTVTLKIMREPIKVNVRMAGLHVHREAVAVFFYLMAVVMMENVVALLHY